MKKRYVFGTALLVVASTLLYWSTGDSEPIFKEAPLENATSTTFTPSLAWPLQESDEAIAGEASGVAVGPNGDVYYLHRGSSSYAGDTYIKEPTLIVLDGETSEVKGRLGSGLFKSPHGLTVDAENNIWVTDISLNQVFKLDDSGDVLETFGDAYEPWTEVGLRIRNVLPKFPAPLSDTMFARPTDVTVFPDGSFVVADGYRNSRIVKFSADGTLEWEKNQLGREDGTFNLPHGISSDDAMNLYVADRDNARVQVFDEDGKHLDTWDMPELGRPYGIEVGADGRVYVADGGDYLNGREDDPRSQVVILDRDGTILERFGTWGDGVGELRIAHDIAVSPEGDVYVAELLNKRIQQFKNE